MIKNAKVGQKVYQLGMTQNGNFIKCVVWIVEFRDADADGFDCVTEGKDGYKLVSKTSELYATRVAANEAIKEAEAELRAAATKCKQHAAPGSPLAKLQARQQKDAATPKKKVSNKEQVYKAWRRNTRNVEKLSAVVNDAVKLTTIKNWISSWKNGNNLPACAK